MPALAQRMSRAKPSAIMVIADKAKTLKAAGRSIVNFSIGVPNFLPGEHVYEAVRAALKTDTGAYGSNRGRDDLLDAFLAHMREGGLTGYTRANLATGVGAKQVLYNLCEALLDPGARADGRQRRRRRRVTPHARGARQRWHIPPPCRSKAASWELRND